MENIVRQQELVKAIAERLWVGAPAECIKIRAVFVGAGISYGLEVETDTLDENEVCVEDPFNIPLEIAELRDSMAVPGLGTWFTFVLTITRAGDVTTEFDYDRPSDDALRWLDFSGDLERYPRDVTPKWMSDAIEDQSRM
ncbi:hypothetical protein ACWIGI_03175 [Nocardia sp. NPDC055321]